MHMKYLTVEGFEDMIESVTEIVGLWAIVSSLMIASTFNSFRPVLILLTQPLKRYNPA